MTNEIDVLYRYIEKDLPLKLQDEDTIYVYFKEGDDIKLSMFQKDRQGEAEQFFRQCQNDAARLSTREVLALLKKLITTRIYLAQDQLTLFSSPNREVYDRISGQIEAYNRVVALLDSFTGETKQTPYLLEEIRCFILDKLSGLNKVTGSSHLDDIQQAQEKAYKALLAEVDRILAKEIEENDA